MRAEQHVRIVGILLVAYAVLFFVVGLLLIPFRGVAEERIPDFLIPLVWALALVPLVAGIGVLRRRRWGRTLGFVAAAVSLLSFPLGTALGVYTFWVLTRADAKTLLSRD